MFEASIAFLSSNSMQRHFVSLVCVGLQRECTSCTFTFEQKEIKRRKSVANFDGESFAFHYQCDMTPASDSCGRAPVTALSCMCQYRNLPVTALACMCQHRNLPVTALSCMCQLSQGSARFEDTFALFVSAILREQHAPTAATRSDGWMRRTIESLKWAHTAIHVRPCEPSDSNPNSKKRQNSKPKSNPKPKQERKHQQAPRVFEVSPVFWRIDFL
jgi:hypothetical protein